MEILEINQLQGVLLSPLKIIPGEKGNVLHALKSTDIGFAGFQEAYFSTVNYNDVKGWKKHYKMTLNLVVICGSIRFIAYDDRVDSPTNGKFGSVELSRSNYFRLTVPPGLWVSFSGKDNTENLLVNLANLLHDPMEAENIPLNSPSIPWIWS